MRRMRALNESGDEETDESGRESVGETDSRHGKGETKLTREAEEALVQEKYRNALLKLANEEKAVAKELFQELLNGKLLKEIDERPESAKDNTLTSLYYAICKNMGVIFAEENKHAEALDLFIKASQVDDTEALLWYKLGIQAFKVENYYTARIGLERCLDLSPDFWPCLDNLVSLTYIETDYPGCLFYIERCLEKKEDYLRGLAVKDEIFRNPSIKEWAKERFAKYENRTYDLERAREIMDKLNAYVEKKAERNQWRDLETVSPDFDLEDFSVTGIGRAIQKFFSQLSKEVQIVNPIDVSRWIGNVKTSCADAQPMDAAECVVVEESAATEKPIAAAEEQTSCDIRMEVGERHENEAVNPMDTTVESSNFDSDIETVQQMAENPDQPSTPNGATTPADQDDPQSSPVLSCSTPVLPIATYRRGGWKRKRGGSLGGGQSVFKRRSTRLIPGFHMEDPEAFGPLTTKPVSLSEHLRSYMPMIFARHGDTEQEAQRRESDVGKASTAEEVHSAPLFDDIFTKEEALAFLESRLEFLEYRSDTVLRLLWDYLDWLRRRASCSYRWSESLRQVFIDCYECLTDHSQLQKPPVHEDNDELKTMENQRCRLESHVRLIYAEFKAWEGTEQDLENLVRLEGHLAFVARFDMVFDYDQEEWSKFWCRVLWMNANMHERRKNYGGAHWNLECCLHTLETCLGGHPIPLHHCESTISTASLKRRMEHFEQAGLLDQIEAIFAQSEYQSAVDILTTHLFASKGDEGTGMDRLRQYEILLMCYRLLEKNQDIPTSFVRALKFSVVLYGRIDVEEKKKWWTRMGNILSIGERAFFGQNTASSVDSLNTAQRYILASSLIDIIMLADESPLKKEEMPNWCWLSPWNILYQLSRHLEMPLFDEAYAKGWYEKANNSTVILATRSLMILWKCHEELGRRRLCMIRNGMFLTYLAEEILQTLRHPIVSQCISSSCTNDTLNCAEQCFYCLYKYPAKKKRHLEEHDATPVELDWQKALLLFDFVKPDQAPEFDDHPHTTAVSTDSVQLLHKIEAMVPKMLRPEPFAKQVDDFFNNSLNEDYPQMGLENEPIISDLYHLLADFYLKTQDFEKAVKYYEYDLCVCADRFDSWAGLAMARGALLDRRLRSMELKYDSDAQAVVAREARAALYCYRRATEIRKTHYVLLVEYGTLAYASHSFFSRALKHGGIKLKPTEKEKLIKLRNIYLKKAENALLGASVAAQEPTVVHKEEWIHNYLLGKIAEKRKAAHLKDPTVALARYHASSYHLDEDGARYPERIKYTPQRYSLEVLEVFYRVHACTLKWLLRGNVTDGMIKKVYRFVEMFRGSPIYDCKKDIRLPATARLFCDLEIVDLVESLLDEVVGQKDLDAEARADIANVDRDGSADSSPSAISKMRRQLVKWCSEAFQLCIRRFSNHFKSHYWLSQIYFAVNEFKDIKKSRQLLLGPVSIPQCQVHLGLFQHRKPSNFFEGIWSIPLDDISRAGSFSEHMFRSIVLLCRVLAAVQDYHFLCELLIALHRKPATDKHKYLREPDRQELLEVASATAEQVFVKVFEKDPDESLVAIYRLHLQLYKMQFSSRSRWCDLLRELLTKKTNKDFRSMDAQIALNVCAALEKTVNISKCREIVSPRKSAGGLPDVQALYVQPPAPVSMTERRSTNEGSEVNSRAITVASVPKTQSMVNLAQREERFLSPLVGTGVRSTLHGHSPAAVSLSTKTTAVRPLAPLGLASKSIPTTTSVSTKVASLKPISTAASAGAHHRSDVQASQNRPSAAQKPSTSRTSVTSESPFTPSHLSAPRTTSPSTTPRSSGTDLTTSAGPSSSSISAQFASPFDDLASTMMMSPEQAFLAAYLSQMPPGFYEQLANPFAQAPQLAQLAQQLSMVAPNIDQAALAGLRMPTITETPRSGIPPSASMRIPTQVAQQRSLLQAQMRRSMMEERAEQARNADGMNAGARSAGPNFRGVARYRHNPYNRFKTP